MGNAPLKVSKSSIIKSNKYLKEDSIEDVQVIFRKLQRQKNTKDIDRKTFGTLFRYPAQIVDSIFDEFDADSNGTIDSDEFLRGMALCSSGDLNSKIRFCFDAYDSSGDGFLQKEELEGLVLSTTFSSFALLDSVGRSMDMAAQQSKAIGKEKQPDKPMERLQKKAAFKKEVNWMVTAAYQNSDKNDDNKLNYEEFFAWVSNTPQVMEVLYGTFQLRNEAKRIVQPQKQSSIRNSSRTSGSSNGSGSSSLFRSSGKISPTPSPEPPESPPLPLPTPRVPILAPEGPCSSASSEPPEALDGHGESASKLVKHQTDTAQLRNIWRHRGNVTFFVSLLGLFCMVLERLVLHHAYDDKPNAFTTTMRYIIAGDCALLVCCLVRWTSSNIMLMRAQGHVNPMASICSTPFVRQRLTYEIIIALIHVPPHLIEALQDYPSLQYWLTNILSWSMLLRIYLLPSMLQQYFIQKYVTLKQEFLARLSNVQFSVLFTLRAELRIQPFRLVVGSLLITLVITTFLLEEAELGLGCVNTLANVTTANVTSLTMIQVHSGGSGGAGAATEWHWLYEDKCHAAPAIPGLGWFYYSLNLALIVGPRRIPMTPTGEGFNIIAGGISLAIFAITIAAVQNILEPTLSEQRVLQVIREERVRLEIRRAAINLIQRSWRIYAHAKRNLRNAAKAKGIDFEESYGPHWDQLGSKKFQRQLETSRKKISISLFKWKQQKRNLRSNIPMLDGVSIDVSYVVNELMQLDGEYKRIQEKITNLETKLTVNIPEMISKLKLVKQLVR